MDLEKEILAKKGLIDSLAGIATNPRPESQVIFAKMKLLWQCNLSCIYCDKPAPTPPMPRRVVKEMLNGLTILGLKKIHFSGGEVFTHPEIYGILEDACNLGLQVNLTTNGTLLDKDGISKISDMGVHCVSLSLDSADHSIHDRLRGVKGAFKATVKAISRLARRERPKLRINTVLTRENSRTLDALHGLLTGI
ncbi:MAG: radical SAM protein, partial [Nitrospirae bacterium]|nr:radical SAM protein [Nitrospirota bacterium]